MTAENRDRPAFPTNARMFSEAQGMTKREYFAAIAMQGMLANDKGAMTEGSNRSFSPYDISKTAIQHADELLKQLES